MNTNPLRRPWSLLLAAAGGTLAIMAVGALVTAYSGCVDVAATSSPSGLTRWFLATTRQHSVASRASDLEVPKLDSAKRVAEGAEHYNEMCVGCHGAPGVSRSEVGQGLEPRAPSLSEGPLDDGAAKQTFWIVKHGIKMTGMPAFGATHDDDRIWDIVAFVRKLHGMSAAEYAKETANAEDEGVHEHGPEAHDHGAASDDDDHSDAGHAAHQHAQGHD